MFVDQINLAQLGDGDYFAVVLGQRKLPFHYSTFQSQVDICITVNGGPLHAFVRMRTKKASKLVVDDKISISVSGEIMTVSKTNFILCNCGIYSFRRCILSILISLYN